MEKVLKLNKTDVETDDIASEYEYKRKHSDSDSSESELNPLKIIKLKENDNEEIEKLTSFENFTTVQNENNNLESNEEEKIAQNNIQVQNEEIVPTNFVLVPEEAFNSILHKLNNLDNMIKEMNNKIDKILEKEKVIENINNDQFKKNRCSELLPIKNESELINLNEMLSTDKGFVNELV